MRFAFSEDAERYDRARPGYPAELFDVLTAAVGEAARVLEIGCGTGQASVPLAARGFALTALELSEELAALARRNLGEYHSARVVVQSFEEWALPPVGFDLVVAAMSFDRLDPEQRMTKAGDALRPRGALAVISTHHIAGGSESFFAQAGQCYECFAPTAAPERPLPTPGEIPRNSEEFHRSRRFGAPEFHEYEWEAQYTSAEYLDLLRTYSDHRRMPDSAREQLLGCIEGHIDDHGGVVSKRYLTQLALAQRLG
ncbi:class I SAM-dependent methyltransferase [Saccharopolyspora tripterygii]